MIAQELARQSLAMTLIFQPRDIVEPDGVGSHVRHPHA